MSPVSATGIVLAGGRSSRFGRDKLSEPYRGVPLVHHAVLRLGEVCDEVVVVLAPGSPEPTLPIGVPVRIARDALEGEGPLAGAYAGLLAVRSDLAVLAAGDMPDLRTPVLLEMLRVAEETPADAVALRDGDRFRPLPCVLRSAEALDAAHTLLHAGERRLRTLLSALRLFEVDEPTWTALDPERRTLLDIDEPGDLAR